MAEIRIISGLYKNRRIAVRDATGLRPSPERVRETLFNWLQWDIKSASVLDAFAGSGALGLEALSRGAASVIFIDNERENIKKIQDLLKKWQAVGAQCLTQNALHFSQPQDFDLIFLDPPFGAEILTAAIRHFLPQLKKDGFLYTESASPWEDAQQNFAEDLLLHRSGRAGAVHFALWKRL